MTFEMALNNLYTNYKRYGYEKEEISSLLNDGVRKGFSVNAAYNGIRMVLAETTGEKEFFTIDDVAEITGESPEDVTKRIEEYNNYLKAAGVDTDDYFKVASAKKTVSFYFPNGVNH